MNACLGPGAAAGPRRSSWWLRALLALALVAAALAAAGRGVLSQPQFGAAMSGAQLERAKANPQYRDRRFFNLQPETPSSAGAMFDYVIRQFSGDEVRAAQPVLSTPLRRNA